MMEFELKLALLYVMALFYFLAGVMHFVNPKFFLRIVPPKLPAKLTLVYISGIAEIVLGIGLIIPGTQSLAAWGVILLLIAVFPANIYQYMAKGAGMRVPQWALLIRLPLQFVLILWAFWYT
jgi:uncharacterized membrane protein